jgi:hypothetical protein
MNDQGFTWTLFGFLRKYYEGGREGDSSPPNRISPSRPRTGPSQSRNERGGCLKSQRGCIACLSPLSLPHYACLGATMCTYTQATHTHSATQPPPAASSSSTYCHHPTTAQAAAPAATPRHAGHAGHAPHARHARHARHACHTPPPHPPTTATRSGPPTPSSTLPGPFNHSVKYSLVLSLHGFHCEGVHLLPPHSR